MQQPSQPKKRPRILVIGGIGAGLLVVMCLCLVVIGALAPDSDGGVVGAPTVVERAIVEAGATATDVQLAAPTDTSVPEPTPAPTDTPLPAPTLAPTDTPVVAPTATLRPATPTPAPAAVPAGAVAARLKGVVDGDTIDVLISDEPDRVRLIGIDTPERGDPGYRAATEAHATLLGSGELYLVADTSDRDSFGRLLRYVYTQDGAMVNREMIAQGWAQPVEYPPDVSYAAEFRVLAGEAAEDGLGFWGGVASDGAMPYALTSGSANIRSGPGTTFEINTTASPDIPLTVVGRTPDGGWLQVRAPDLTDGWIAASLVALNVAASQVSVASNIPAPPVVQQPASPTAESRTAPAVVPQSTLQGIVLLIVQNNSTFEILQVSNQGPQAVDISGWVLYGSKGDDRCVIPGGTSLQPGEGFQVATGDSQPHARGMKCGDKPIWNNQGGTIYLEAPGAGRIEIQSRRV